MVKSVIAVNHRGLHDWLFQRVTAFVMAIYSVGMIVFFLMNNNLAFADWHNLFAHPWMKIFTFLFVISLLYHAWIGMWTVVTDYIKPVLLALLAHVIVFFTLAASLLWSLMILWSV